MNLASTSDINTTCEGTTCMNCWVKQFSLLDGLDESELEVLNSDRGTQTFAPGEVIFKEGESPKGLLCLREGKVKITKRGILETNAIISLNRPVDFLGIEALILEKKYRTSAVAIDQVSICYLGANNFLKILKQNSTLSLRVMALLAEKNIESNKRMLVLTQKHLRGRLADALLLLHKQYGYQTDNKTLNVQLKRAELAALANMTTANAIRVLSVFAKEQLIDTNKRNISILNIEGLIRVSQLG